MPLKIPLLKSLQCLSNEEGEGTWIGIDDFFNFLRQNHTTDDKIKDIRKRNIEREINGHKDGVKTINGKDTASLTSILRFIFNHCDQLNICKRIVSQIEQRLGPFDDNSTSIKDVYIAICKTSLKHNVLEANLFSDLVIEESEIPSLHDHYKNDFTSSEWQKICFFEHHFSKMFVGNLDDSYENLVTKRWEFLEKLKISKRFSKDIDELSKITIRHRTKRKQAAEEWFHIQIEAEKIHIPDVLEKQIQSHVNEFCNAIGHVACVGCTDSCDHEASIHVYFELKTTEIQVSDIVTLITHFLQKKHGTSCHQIIFCLPGAFKNFVSSDGVIERFRLRDVISSRKLNCEIYHSWDSKQKMQMSNNQPEEKCSQCFDLELPKPLHWNEFDYAQEWLLDVPLIIQILLETFINSDSLRRSEITSRFIKSKITKLYTLYDTLLNTFNRNYIGVFQDISTQDLSMNYQSITTVFSITSTSGVTLSLREAEERMKEKSNADLCYYNTYLKKHRIEYDSESGNKIGYVSLRDCLLVLMLDNLVRLKYHADPNPGENRSQQICTLPITLKGVPKDALDVLKWHDGNLCEGESLCTCKGERQLDQNDIKSHILSQLPEEEEVNRKFQKLCTWGFSQIWQAIHKSDKWKHIKDSFLKNTTDENAGNVDENDLEWSFASLSVHECSKDVEDTDDGESEVGDAGFMHNMEIDTDDETEQTEEQENISNLLNNIKDYEVDLLFEKASDELDIFFKPLDQSDSDNDSTLAKEMSIDESFSFLSIATQNVDMEDDHSENIQMVVTHADETEHGLSETTQQNELLQSLFTKHIPPPTITRHPPPATGRDDDINKLKEVLDGVLEKADCIGDKSHHTKILFAPDHKIGNNLLKLVEQKKYQVFLPEFPNLHLRKSKITNFCSAYKNAGVLHVLKYMRDEDSNEWKKLISAEHIEKATQYIRRIALALHTAFMLSYMKTLSEDEASKLFDIMLKGNGADTTFEEDYEKFLANGTKNNATFALHREILQHCDEISAIAFAERLGGHDGYNLMLSSVKSSLPFSFLNGATSYAAYCTRLLFEHYKCGPFYTNMKKALFSTPYKGSSANFGLDTQREMEHKDVLKGFRSGATMSSVLPRMSLVDSMLDVNETRNKNFCTKEEDNGEIKDDFGLDLSETDINYILRLTELFITRDAISVEENPVIKNVYSEKCEVLPENILDSNTNDIGHFLIQKFISFNNLFGCKKSDIPDISSMTGPKLLINKVKSAKGFTIRRNFKQGNLIVKSERQNKEVVRQKQLIKSKKELECMSSEMNACQAIVKPDCSKPKVQKSQGVQKALTDLLYQFSEKQSSSPDRQIRLRYQNLVHIGCKDIPEIVSKNITMGTLEFAGIKFKANVITGSEYLRFIENGILKKILKQFGQLKRIAVCEEKYQFTPDDFKAATRNQRQQKKKVSISHLKSGKDMLNSNTFDKASLVTTAEGKSLIGTYLARNVSALDIKRNVTLDIDSELHLSGCACNTRASCSCKRYATPVSCEFDSEGSRKIHLQENIQQSKGEAEMAQIDWLIEYIPSLQSRDACVSIVTSGDIDAVLLHMFSISYLWPRNQDGTFLHTVYVILQKPGGLNDIYNITEIVSLLEGKMNEKYFGMKVAVTLSIGGNDFLPKFYGISHSRVLNMFVENSNFRSSLFSIAISENDCQMKINENVFEVLIKALYCPKRLIPEKLEFEDVRQITVRVPTRTGNGKPRNPQNWMPPASSLRCLAKHINCLIRYYTTAGNHKAELPDFLSESCLRRSIGGELEYNLGPEVHVSGADDILTVPEDILCDRMRQAAKAGKRRSDLTPQKGRRMKKAMTSTPKSRKKEPFN